MKTQLSCTTALALVVGLVILDVVIIIIAHWLMQKFWIDLLGLDWSWAIASVAATVGLHQAWSE